MDTRGISFRGRPLPAPNGTVAIEIGPNALASWPVRLPADLKGDPPLLVESGGGDDAPLHLFELDADPLALTAGLDAAARWRLLDFLLNFCCAAFRLGTTPSFARLCVGLALDCTRHAGIATVEAQVLAGRVLLSGVDVPHDSTLCILRRSTVAHSTTALLRTGRLQVVPQVTSGDLIVACGSDPITWTVDEPPIVPHVLALPENGRIPGALVRAACRKALVRDARTEAVAQLLRDMDFLYPAPARKIDDPSQPICGEVEFAIPDNEGGIFLAGWLRDPLGMIDTMELVTDAGRIALAPEAIAPAASPGYRETLYIRHASRRRCQTWLRSLYQRPERRPQRAAKSVTSASVRFTDRS